MNARHNTGQAAAQAVLVAAVGGRESVARRASASALRTDPQPTRPYRPLGWLRIVAPPSWSAQARAHCWCACGFERNAIGRSAVQLLITAHTEHRDTCPLLTAEGRDAA
ncbi:hypothetical protein [Streptomyces sp. NPDC002402]